MAEARRSIEGLDVVYLALCSGCSGTFVLPYPRPMRHDSQGRALEPDPWFCSKQRCQGYRAEREKRLADQERIGSAHRLS